MKIERQNAPDLEKLGDLIEDFSVAMMIAMDENDRLVARPMSPLKMDTDGVLWFFTNAQSDKAQQIDRVNLSFADEGDALYVSIAGKGELNNDPHLIRELWTPLMKPWFPDGVESPNLALLKVTPQTAEYWDSTHNKMVRMFATAASLIASKPLGMGEHGKLTLIDNP